MRCHAVPTDTKRSEHAPASGSADARLAQEWARAAGASTACEMRFTVGVVEEPETPIENSLLPEVRKISNVLTRSGYRCWAVGGCIRDILLEHGAGPPASTRTRPQGPGDWDLATDARPDQVQKLFRRVVPTGIQHGTVTVLLGGQSFEVTTLRGETTYSDGRHPDSVYFVDDLREDLARRDFTINALAYDIEHNRLHDPFGGLADLEQGLIRAVGEPSRRFEEDGLRVLRCARFCATLNMDVEVQTRAAIRPSLPSFEKVAQERVQQEWWKALASRRPSRCFGILHHEGLLTITAPELFSSPTADEKGFESAMQNLDAAPAEPLLRLAVLCHWGLKGDGDPAKRARQLARRLRLSKPNTSQLHHLLAMRSQLPSLGNAPTSGPALRRLLSQIGRSQVEQFLQFLPYTVALSEEERAAERFGTAARQELEAQVPLDLGELAVSGSDLIEQAGLSPGPAIGRTLRRLLDQVLENPDYNQRQTLVEMAKNQQATE